METKSPVSPDVGDTLAIAGAEEIQVEVNGTELLSVPD
jgi:hypothetical protein